MSQERFPSPYRRAVIIHNPNKRNTLQQQAVRQQVAHAAAINNLQIVGVETEPDATVTQDKVLRSMREHDVLVPITGDGGLSIVANGLMRVEPDKRRPILPTMGGSANDFYRNRMGRLKGKTALADILKLNRIMHIHSIDITVADPDQPADEHYYGLNNAGFHYTADFSDRLNGEQYRTSQLRKIPMIGQTVLDLLTIQRSFADLSTYEYKDIDGSSKTLLDRTLVHARLAGKHGHFPSSHLSESFLDLQTVSATPASIALSGISMAAGMRKGSSVREIAFMNGPVPIRGHVDGEPFSIGAQASVTAQLAESGLDFHTMLTE